MDSSVFSGRKIVAALTLLVVACVVTYFKGDLPPGLGSFMQTLFGAFVLGNGIEHAAAAYVAGQTTNPNNK